MKEHSETEFSFKSFFIPFTTTKAIHFIIFIGLIVYGNSLFNGFVVDDITYIVDYSVIHSFNFFTLIGKNIFNFDSQYRPIPAIYFAVLYSIFTTNAFYYHVIQLTLQVINSILVFFLFRHFFNKHIAFLTAIVFLVHPMQVESVSYIASSDNPLFFLFGICALLLSLKDTVSWRRGLTIFFLLLVSLLTKETGVLFIGIIVLYRLIFNRKQLIPFVIFSLLTFSVYIAIRFGIGGIYFPQGRQDLLPVASLPMRLLSTPLIIFYYIVTFIFPIKLAMSQEWMVKQMSMQFFYIPLIFDLLFFIGLGWIGAYVMKINSLKGKYFLFFFLWFGAGLVFHSQIFPLDMTVADRWFYFPIVGLLGLISAGIYYLEPKISRKTKVLVYALAILIIILFSVRTIVRNADWGNNITLYSHDISVSDNYQLESSLGTEYYNAGNYPEALRYFQRSENLLPYGVNLTNLGSTYELLGNKKKARGYFSEVITTYGHDKNYPLGVPVYLEDSYLGLSRISLLSGNFNASKTYATNGIKLFPDDVGLWVILAISEYKQHDQKGALIAAKQALKLQPDDETNQIYWKISNNLSLTIQFNEAQN